MENLRIIQVSESDMDELLQPISELFDKYRQFYGRPPDLARSRSFLKKRIENQDSVIFAALASKSEVAGFAQLYPLFSSITVDKKWLLNDLYVPENFRRQGVARRLLRRVSRHAAETAAGSVILQTKITNTSAQALYESLGYVREKEHYTYFIKL